MACAAAAAACANASLKLPPPLNEWGVYRESIVSQVFQDIDGLLLRPLIEIIVDYYLAKVKINFQAPPAFLKKKHFHVMAPCHGSQGVLSYFQAAHPLFQLSSSGERFLTVNLQNGGKVLRIWQPRTHVVAPDALVSVDANYYTTERGHLTVHREQHGGVVAKTIPIPGVVDDARVSVMTYDPLFQRLILATTAPALMAFDLQTSTFKPAPETRTQRHIHFSCATDTGFLTVSRDTIEVFDQATLIPPRVKSLDPAKEDYAPFGLAAFGASMLHVSRHDAQGSFVETHCFPPLTCMRRHRLHEPLAALSCFGNLLFAVTQNGSHQILWCIDAVTGLRRGAHLLGSEGQVDPSSPLTAHSLTVGPKMGALLSRKEKPANLQLFEYEDEGVQKNMVAPVSDHKTQK